MFSDFPGLFGKNFAIGFLLPALVIVLGLTGLIVASEIAEIPPFLTETNPIISSAVLTLLSWLLGILLMGANRDIIRILEGYGQLNPFKLFLWLERRKFRNLQRKISSLEIMTRSDRQEDELNRLFIESVTNYPDDEKFLLPTPFGNAIRAFEVYPRLLYGVESIVLWSRLLSVVPEEYKAHIDDAKAHMDFWVNLGVSSIFLLVASTAIKIYIDNKSIAVHSWLFWLLIILEVATMFLCHYRATRAAILWGQTVKSAFDIYLPDLASKIGLEMPNSRAEQKLVWQNYCIAILYAREDYLPALKAPSENDNKTANNGFLARIAKFLFGEKDE